MHPDDEFFDYDESDPIDTTCHECNGVGGDPWNDYCLSCEACDGMGYRWWE